MGIIASFATANVEQHFSPMSVESSAGSSSPFMLLSAGEG